MELLKFEVCLVAPADFEKFEAERLRVYEPLMFDEFGLFSAIAGLDTSSTIAEQNNECNLSVYMYIYRYKPTHILNVCTYAQTYMNTYWVLRLR